MAYRVFISSTLEDLAAHRIEVLRAVRAAGFDADPMEQWSSSHTEPLQLCLERVDYCDLLVLLVARRRGYIPSGYDRSIVQLEYDRAIERGIDVLTFLLNEDADWPHQWDERSSDPGYAEWLQELSRTHTVQYFDMAPETLNVSPSLTRWVQSQIPDHAPRQLPRAPTDFIGRGAERSQLYQQLTGDTAALCGIFGLGGVGKTSLALHVSQQLQRHYRNGQLYLDLKGSTQPLSRISIMSHVVRSLGGEVNPSDDETTVQGHFYSTLSGKRVLLVLDNAAGREQVETLIPPAGCGLIVTSRRFFTLPGLRALRLGEMSSKESEQLLESILPEVGTDAGAISRACGGLPLALRLAGNTLSMRPDLGTGEYLRRLSREQDRIDTLDSDDKSHGVSASLSLSHAVLPDRLKELTAKLSVFRHDFDRAAIAALWLMPEQDAGAALGDILNSSLLLWDSVNQRYRMHDLVRLFEWGQLDADDRSAVLEQHAKVYLSRLREAVERYRSGGDGVQDGLARFDRDWENISAGFEWCVNAAPEHEQAALLCASYAADGATILQLRQHRSERIRWFESGLAQAQRLENHRLEAALLSHLGIAWGNLGELSRAISYHQRSLELTQQTGDETGQAIALENLGEALWRSGQQRESIASYQQALELARNLEDPWRESNSLLNIALAHWQLGEPDHAIEVADQCLHVARRIGDRQKEAQSLGILGISHNDLGNQDRAIELGLPYLSIAREMADRFSEGTAMIILGVAYRERGELVTAVDYLTSAQELLRDIGDRFFEGEASYELGLAFAGMGERQRAAEAIGVRLAYRREIDHPGAEDDESMMNTFLTGTDGL